MGEARGKAPFLGATKNHFMEVMEFQSLPCRVGKNVPGTISAWHKQPIETEIEWLETSSTEQVFLREDEQKPWELWSGAGLWNTR